ncbi:conserved hypothetical protein [Clostridioides difficile]|uniref:Uncharacterized protein n=2 Tax=Bacteria TaxID=2 RepID=A0A069A253_CLODI|nr:conserved hypothetical protein [Clostridioides difficile]
MGVNNSLSEVIELDKLRIISESNSLTKDGLTEKDLYCIGKFIQIGAIKSFMHNEKDLDFPCTDCKYSDKCFGDNRESDFWDTFLKLSKLTDLKLSPVKGFKIN